MMPSAMRIMDRCERVDGDPPRLPYAPGLREVRARGGPDSEANPLPLLRPFLARLARSRRHRASAAGLGGLHHGA